MYSFFNVLLLLNGVFTFLEYCNCHKFYMLSYPTKMSSSHLCCINAVSDYQFFIDSQIKLFLSPYVACTITVYYHITTCNLILIYFSNISCYYCITVFALSTVLFSILYDCSSFVNQFIILWYCIYIYIYNIYIYIYIYIFVFFALRWSYNN